MEYHFDMIVPIETADTYLEHAFSKAKKDSTKARGSFMGSKNLDRIQKSRIAEISKITSVKDSLFLSFDKIGKSFPSVDSLGEFYQELMRLTLDVAQLKKSLGAVNWAKRQIIVLFQEYERNIRRSRDLEQMNDNRRRYLGRVSSVVKQIKDELRYLTQARKVFRTYPTIKSNMYTVAIAGFPNVGKSTLLSKITSSRPEIAPYPFTTKQILIGYVKEGHHSIQIMDTPGTLNRPEKMNHIEKQAHLAMKYCADVIVYVFDLTLLYPLKDQEKLFDVTKEHGKEIIIYFSKIDLVERKEIETFAAQYPKSFVKILNGPDELRTFLLKKATGKL